METIDDFTSTARVGGNWNAVLIISENIDKELSDKRLAEAKRRSYDLKAVKILGTIFKEVNYFESIQDHLDQVSFKFHIFLV